MELNLLILASTSFFTYSSNSTYLSAAAVISEVKKFSNILSFPFLIEFPDDASSAFFLNVVILYWELAMFEGFPAVEVFS